MTIKNITLAMASGLMLSACIESYTADQRSDTPLIDPDTYQVETLGEGLDFPWGIAFVSQTEFLVTERSGQLRRIVDGVLQAEPISGTPEVYFEGQGGLLDLVLAPDFADTGTLFISYATGNDAQNATAVMRARLDGNDLVDSEVIFTASPWRDTSAHFGGRMIILPDNTLMLTLGDGFAYREEAQRRENHYGTMIRMNFDGSPPADNPFVLDDGPAALVYSYGHRNVQGLTYDPVREIVWENEHGPQGGDELNQLRPGANYGWPIATEGIDYNGARISPYSSHDGFESPVHVWTPSIAPGGMSYYSGALFEDWAGDLFVAGLASRGLHYLDLDDTGNVVGEYRLLRENDVRIRQVAEGPDGALYALVDAPAPDQDGEADAPSGGVLRISPSAE